MTPETVDAERDRIEARVGVVVPLINDVRSNLGEAFEMSVDPVTTRGY